MTDKPSWAPIVRWAVWAVLMSLVMGWIARSRHRSRPTAEQRRLAHPPSTLIIGGVCFVLCPRC